MIASLLAFAALGAVAVCSLVLAFGKTPTLPPQFPFALATASPAVLVLASTAQLNWSITAAAPYILGAALGAVLLLRLTPGVAHTPSSIVVGQAAWSLTCLGSLTAERLYPGSGRTQAMWATLAIFVFLAAAWLGKRWRSTPSSRTGAAIAALGCIGILLPSAPGIGVDVNGAPGWIELGPMVGQPAEIARPLIVIGTGIMLHTAGPSLRSGRISYALGACWPLAVAAFVGAYTSDFGPVLVLSAAVGAMLLLCRPRPKHILMLFAAAAVTGAALVVSVSVLRERVDQMLHPVTALGDLHNTGAALRAFANGGLVV